MLPVSATVRLVARWPRQLFVTSSVERHLNGRHVHYGSVCQNQAGNNSSNEGCQVQLTRLQYPVQRGHFSQVLEDDLATFRAILDDNRVITAADQLATHNTDWWRYCRGESRVLLRPRSTAEVSAIMRHCHQRHLAVCPQAGNTAVVGSGVPVFDEIILSTQLMNEITSFDPLTGTLQCQAGCVLETVDQYLAERGHMAPIDLGAKGSCQIGGNLATNAGGLRLFRYGSLHANVLGLEAVLPDGEVIDLMSSMKKDNTGYDLKHLFIGSEGTLGVITRVIVTCPRRPSAVNLAFLGVDSFDDVLQVYSHAKQQLAEVLSSCEFIDLECLKCAEQNLSMRAPLQAYPCNILIETSGSNEQHDQDKLSSFLENMLNLGLVKDGTLASNSRETQSMWLLRESLPDAVMRDGHAWLYDISLPLAQFYACVDHMRHYLSTMDAGRLVIRVCGFGHLGDGNIHLNVTAARHDASLERVVEERLFAWTAECGGSISAEHGIGFRKRHLLSLSKSASAIRLMHALKRIIDPRGILNPYKVLPPGVE